MQINHVHVFTRKHGNFEFEKYMLSDFGQAIREKKTGPRTTISLFEIERCGEIQEEQNSTAELQSRIQKRNCEAEFKRRIAKQNSKAALNSIIQKAEFKESCTVLETNNL